MVSTKAVTARLFGSYAFSVLGYLEVTHVQYYDNVLTFLEVKSYEELMSMFDIHDKEKVIEMFITQCDPTKTFKAITE